MAFRPEAQPEGVTGALPPPGMIGEGPPAGRSRGAVAVSLLVILLVAFPKGGIKLGPVPITFGYMFLGVLAAISALLNLARGRYRSFSRRPMLAFWATLPLQGVTILLALSVDSAHADYTFSFVVGFVLLPWVFLFVLLPQIRDMDLRDLETWVCRCVSFAAAYGIFLFIYVIIRKKFFYIPYLTINAGDVSQFASGDPTKDIYRGGGIFKLISTYDNGNIYGAAILMLLPLYDLVQRSRVWRLVVRASLLMTLSRTVWFGLVAYELIAALYVRKLRRITLFYILLFLAITLGGVLYLLSFMHFGLGFVFDPTLGGRTKELHQIRAVLAPGDIVFPSEIIYVNVLIGLGIAGLVGFLIAMLSPIFIAVTGSMRNDSYVKTFVLGMGMLLICGFSDGPILLIPIMAFYWALAALALTRKLPERQ